MFRIITVDLAASGQKFKILPDLKARVWGACNVAPPEQGFGAAKACQMQVSDAESSLSPYFAAL
jgi:hypothetical protein